MPRRIEKHSHLLATRLYALACVAQSVARVCVVLVLATWKKCR